MNAKTYDFRIGSLNVRGINKHSKRISIFNWVKKQNFDIMFLQETFSSVNDEILWQSEWEGQAFWSHGSTHSRGVAILIKKGFDFEQKHIILDPNGRYILIKALIQGEIIYIVNIYAPNTEKDIFFKSLHNTLINNEIDKNDMLLIGGDWNTIISNNLDKSGGLTINKDIPEMKSILLDFDLIDIWRLKNPTTKRYTFRQRKPLVQTRLDYFMISNLLCDMVDKAQILSSFCSDHSCVSLNLTSIPYETRGRGYWKFNSSLLNDNTYVDNMKALIEEWNINYDYIDDKNVKWELIKYEIRKFTISYSSKKKRDETLELETLHLRLDELEKQLGNSPNNNILNEYNEYKSRINEIEDHRAQGSIIRSKIDWLEKGEKSTKFFFGIEKSNYIKKHIRKLELSSGVIMTDQKNILKQTANYYENLYTSRENCNEFSTFRIEDIKNIPKLNETQQGLCDSKITLNECYEVLNTFKNNKSPGNDGLTKEFYVKFWHQISPSLLECYDYSFKNGCMSVSQRQAVITLIEKKGQDKTLLNNWRPISLLNVDYKLITKVFANRLKEILPFIISSTQTGYVKERNIEDSIRLVQDIVNFLDINNLPGILLAVDFQKAFDSLEWSFIKQTLQKFNFGPTFIQWFQLFYTDISSCVINNGNTSRYFKIQRGVRQGDPLSPYIFILAVEILACAIKQNNTISGITIGDKMFKLTQYADDLTLTVRDLESVNNALALLDKFGNCSGLKINTTKTEGMLLGSLREMIHIKHNVKFSNTCIKLLGIFISNNSQEIIMENFQSKIDSLIRQLHWWKARDLSLKGRVLIIKSLGLSKFQYLSSLLPVPKSVISQVNTLIYEFIWKGKTDKVKRDIFEQNYSKGGFKMANLSDIATASSMMWIKKYLDNTDRLWKHTFEYFCKKKNLNIYLRSNFELKELPDTLPDYYTNSIRVWSEMTRQKANTQENLDKDQYIWYNKKIKIGGSTVYNSNLFRAGLWQVSDLFDDNITIPFSVWVERGANEADQMVWLGIVKILKRIFLLPVSKLIHIECGIEDASIHKVTQKHIKDFLRNVKYAKIKDKDEKYKLKANNLYGPVENEQWCDIFQLVHNAPVDNKIKELQYKIIMRFIPTNYLLYKMKKINSPNCTFCMLAQQTIEHLFYHCVCVKNLWMYVLDKWNRVTGQNINLSLRMCILGIYDTNEQTKCMSLNIVILIVKQYIMHCKYDQVELNTRGFECYFTNRIQMLSSAFDNYAYVQLQMLF